MKKTAFLFTGFFLAALPVQAMHLQEAISLVLKTNPTVIQAAKDVEIAKENKKQAFGAYFPTVTATADAQDVEIDTEGVSTVKGNPKSAGVTLSQTLFKGGALVADVRAKKNELFAAKAAYDNVVQESVLAVVSAYVDVLRDRQVLNLNKNLVSVLDKQLEATKSRFELGEVTKTDIKQAEARMASAEADQLDAQAVLRASEAGLKQVLGVMSPEMIWPENATNLPENVEDVLPDVLANHPKVISSLALLAAEKHNVQNARAGFMPEVTASAAYDATKGAVSTAGAGDINTTRFTVGLSMPLFRGGRTVSEVREAIDKRVKIEQAYEAARRDVEQELVSAFYAYKSSEASLVSRQASEEANKLASEGVNLEAELGQRTVLDVLDAEQELLKSQVDVARAKRNMIVSAYRLKSAMGDLISSNR